MNRSQTTRWIVTLSFATPGAAQRLCAIFCAVAAALATGLITYAQFERIRIVPEMSPVAVESRTSLRLPGRARLDGQDVAVILRLRNSGAAPAEVAITLRDITRMVAVAPGELRRVDLAVDGLQGAGRRRLELSAEQPGVAIEQLEIANIHGHSVGAIELVVVPRQALDVQRGDVLIGCLVALLLLALVVQGPTLAGPPWIRRTYLGATVCSAVFLSLALVAPLVSDYAVLLSRKTVLAFISVVLAPWILRLATMTREDLIAWSRREFDVAAQRKLRSLAILYVGGVIVLAGYVGSFYDSETHLTSLISFGARTHRRAAPEIQSADVFRERRSFGYDGQFYAQLAVDPLARGEQLKDSIDDLGYRARRSLFSWTAYVAGFGVPRWILRAYSLQNLVCWLAIAWLLARRLPPDDLKNVAVWFGCVFHLGLVLSVRHSLLEGPGLLLTLLALQAVESGRRGLATGLLAAATLGKETFVAGVAMLWPAKAGRQERVRTLVATTVAALFPLGLWITYLGWRGLMPSGGSTTNFAAPFTGLASAWGENIMAVSASGWTMPDRLGLLVTFGFSVQILSLMLRPQSDVPAWRLAIASAALAVILGPAVWEGPASGAARVLLPMSVGFNLSLPRDRWFWPVALAGNTTALAGLDSVNAWPQIFHALFG